MRPRQVFELGDAELLDGFILEVNRGQRTQRRTRRLGQEVDARQNQMEMFGIREVGDKNQDQPQRHPPAQVMPDQQRSGRPTGPGLRQQRTQRAEQVAPLLRHGEALADPAEPHVAQDEQPDQQRIAPDAARPHRLHQLYIGPDGQRRRLHHKAPHQEVDHPHQHRHGKQVSQEPIEVAHKVVAQERDGKQRLDHIAQVDQEVKDKAPRNHDVKDAGDASRPPDGPFDQPGGQRRQAAPRRFAPGGPVAGPATNHLIDGAPAKQRIEQ